jgi:hypothetical protein
MVWVGGWVLGVGLRLGLRACHLARCPPPHNAPNCRSVLCGMGSNEPATHACGAAATPPHPFP